MKIKKHNRFACWIKTTTEGIGWVIAGGVLLLVVALIVYAIRNFDMATFLSFVLAMVTAATFLGLLVGFDKLYEWAKRNSEP